MRITFLAHSGFLVELPEYCLLFDYWQGTLPPLPEKPLAVFASHRHPDHFNPVIFSLAKDREDVTFLLSDDIRLGEKKREQLGLDDRLMERVLFLGPEASCSLAPGGPEIETLRSTDEGVAFLLSCGETTLYHAGDLHWWDWAEESEENNRRMEEDFKRNLEPLRGRTIDVAFAPLDPRLGDHYDLGLAWLLNTADIRRVFPMHLWGDFGLVGKFKADHPDLAPAVTEIRGDGESWELPD